MFNAPRPKSSSGLTAALTREQQRWVWESMARRREPSQQQQADGTSELGTAPASSQRSAAAASSTNEHEAAVDPQQVSVAADAVTLEGMEYLCQSAEEHPWGAAMAAPTDMPYLPGIYINYEVEEDPDSDVRYTAERPMQFLDGPIEFESALGSFTASPRENMVEEFLGRPIEDESAPGSLTAPPHKNHVAVEKNEAGSTLPDPDDQAAFDAYTEMITARDCLAVVARRNELRRAHAYLEKQVKDGDTSQEALARLKAVSELLRQFERRWGFAPPKFYRRLPPGIVVRLQPWHRG